ncbi:MAG: hypothetical protein AAGB51_09165 [Planctomycetota bacterium]
MTRNQRRMHLGIWLLLAPAAAASLVLAVLTRAEPPAVDQVPDQPTEPTP